MSEDDNGAPTGLTFSPDHEMADRNQATPHGLGWGYVIYQQIAGVIGAFAIIAFLGHFVDFDWRSTLRELVAVWDALVRPAISTLLEVTIVAFVKWAVGWQIEVPLIVRDYIGVGLAVFLAELRVSIWSVDKQYAVIKAIHPDLNRTDAEYYYTDILPLRRPIALARAFLFMIAAWPYFIVIRAISIIWPDIWTSEQPSRRTDNARKRAEALRPILWRSRCLAFAPVVYFGLMYAANFMLSA